MGESEQWQDVTYQETFDEETRAITRRREADPACKVEDLEGILKSLYIMDGADSEGRGSYKDIVFSARIAAYEAFIAAWKAETGQ